METQTKTNNVFVFDKIVIFFKHTDYHGFVHPYNFLEWTSYVREAYFQATVGNFEEVVNRPIKMMTVKMESTMLDDSTFGDEIEARLTVGKIKRVSFDMIIRFYNRRKEKVVCQTRHTIVFADAEKGKFASIPDEMKNVIMRYEEK